MRSGTTLLERALARVTNGVSTGELRELWGTLLTGGRCGCGSHVTTCHFWSAVLAQPGVPGLSEFSSLRDIQRRYLRHRPGHIVRLILAIRSNGEARQELDSYVSAMLSIYRAIATVSGRTTIIDSSKCPTDLYLLSHLSGLGRELRVIHAVRDPRAVAFSQSRAVQSHRRLESPGRTTPPWAAIAWLWRNALSEACLARLPPRYASRMIYEQFAEQPQAILAVAVAALRLEPLVTTAFVDESSLEMPVDHTVFGNRFRFTTGLVHIAPDLTWQSSLARRSQLAVSAITFPLAYRYGYLHYPSRRKAPNENVRSG